MKYVHKFWKIRTQPVTRTTINNHLRVKIKFAKCGQILTDSTSYRFLQRELQKDGIQQEKMGIQGMERGVSNSGEYQQQGMIVLIIMWVFYVSNVKVGLVELPAN